jgi:RNA polymerase sigma-70 factor (ECF subfamily)
LFHKDNLGISEKKSVMTDAASIDPGMQLSLRDPDVRLMLRAKEGDESAFEELVLNYQDRLIHVFYHLVGSQETAEDLAQETFLRIYRARHGYTPTAKFSTWLFKIANNLASNSRRSKGRRKEVDLNTSSDSAALPRMEEQRVADKSGLMPTRQYDHKEMTQVVQAALTCLNDRQRLAVLLHKFEEMSYSDIGVTMDLTEPAVKSLLSRAREALRVKLENYVKNGEVWSGVFPTTS